MKLKPSLWISCLLLAGLGCGTPTYGNNDSVAYRNILIEEFTGTWCSNCPPVADSLHVLSQDYPELAVIGYHSYEIAPAMQFLYNMDAFGRSCYYDTVRSVPRIYINGKQCEDIRNLRQTIEQVRGGKTDLDMEVKLQHFRLRSAEKDSFEVEVKVSGLENYSQSRLRLHIAFLQDDIQHTWFNQDQVDNALTFMYPDAEGTLINPGNDTYRFAFSLPYHASLFLSKNAYMVAFIQEDSAVSQEGNLPPGPNTPVTQLSRRVLQSVMTELKDGSLTQCEEGVFQPDFLYDEVEIANGQQVHFFDNTFGSEICYQWDFEGGEPSFSQAMNPVVTYPKPGKYPVKLQISTRNGLSSYTREECIEVLDIKPRFGITPNPVKPGKEVEIQLLSLADTCRWQFFGGDPFLAEGLVTTTRFATEGEYDIDAEITYHSPRTGKTYAADTSAKGVIVVSRDASILPTGGTPSPSEISIRQIGSGRYEVCGVVGEPLLEIFSMTGQRVLRKVSKDFSLSGFAEGIYIVRVELSQGERYIGKIRYM